MDDIVGFPPWNSFRGHPVPRGLDDSNRPAGATPEHLHGTTRSAAESDKALKSVAAVTDMTATCPRGRVLRAELRAELGGAIPMELSDRERRLAVVALLVIVLAAGLGTLGAVFSGFSFI